MPIGLVALVLIRRLVPDNHVGAGPEGAPKDPRIDLVGAVLLGLTVLAVLFPLISLEGGAGLPLVVLVAFPLLAWAFVRWEARTVAAGRPPLLDVSLLRGLPGYANGLLVGTLYFTGFTGIFLVLSVHLQEGEGFSPLQAALLMTPFAVGAATTSPLAGRLVGTARPAGDPGRARRDDDRHRARRVAGDLAHRHPVVDPRARDVPRRRRRRWGHLPQLHAHPGRGAAARWVARPAARSRPGSGSAPPSAPRC